MPKVVFRYQDGSSYTVDVTEGTSIMQAAVSEGLEGIIAECGGNAMCATCHVYVDPERAGDLPAMNGEEDDMLDCAESPRESNSRLSCQIPMTSDLEGLTVDIPET